jgi:glucose-6-phosphate isomerase
MKCRKPAPRRYDVAAKPIASALAALRKHRADAPRNMRKAFAADPARFREFSALDGDLLLDWSKCAVTERRWLEKLADAAGLADRRKAMLSGKRINITEDRAVLRRCAISPGVASSSPGRMFRPT